MARCSRGKSCGATCINSSRKCVIELGPKASADIKKVVENLGVVQMYHAVVAKGDRGAAARFHSIQQQFKQEVGGRINKEHRAELQRRLEEAGLLSKRKEEKPQSKDDEIAKAEKKLASIQRRGVEAMKAKDDAAFNKALDEQAIVKKELDLARLKKERDDLNGNSSPEAIARRRELAEGIPRLKNELDDLKKAKAPETGAGATLDKLRQARREAASRGDSAEDRRLMLEIMRHKVNAAKEKLAAGGKETTGTTRFARGDAKDFDGDLNGRPLRREGNEAFDGWKGSYEKGSSKIGEGAFGTVIRNPDGTYVKRGEISDTEAALIKRIGDAGIGPKLIAADINGKSQLSKDVDYVDVRTGRIAMTKVPGKQMGDVSGTTKFGNSTASDIYWKSMADLHRLGIAHNDAHIGNIFVDGKGKGRWVDMGLAQASPKAALAEALGTFGNTLVGANPYKHMPDDAMGHVHEFESTPANWQTRRWAATGVKDFASLRKSGQLKEMQDRYPNLTRFYDNRGQLQYKLLKKYDRDEVAAIMEHGIRSPLHTFEQGPWAKMTNEEAQTYLNELYDGI